MAAETVTPAAEAWNLLQELLHATKTQVMAVAREFELAPPQLFALRTLNPGEPMAMSELAGALHLDNSTVTGIVDRLEEDGLVERRPAAHDRRVKMIVVTESGEAIRERLRERWSQVPTPLRKLSEEDQVALRDILRRALEA